jgi:hypothetical protein
LEIESDRQQIDSKRQSVGAPDRQIRVEADAAVLIGTEPIKPRWHGAALRRVRSGGAALRLGEHEFKGVIRRGRRRLGCRRRPPRIRRRGAEA